MSGKWTPGPWVKDRYGDLRGSDGKQVGTWGAGIAWVSRDDEAEANARLMAAAPEMLEALIGMVYGADNITRKRARARAIVAIAKAEGNA